MLTFLLTACGSGAPMPEAPQPLPPRLMEAPVTAPGGAAYGLLTDAQTAIVVYPDGYTTMRLGGSVTPPRAALGGVVYSGRRWLYHWSEDLGLRRFETEGFVHEVLDHGSHALLFIEAADGTQYWMLDRTGMYRIPARP